MHVQFWFDPICPWCWVTSRWIVDVAEQRGFEVQWEPISLLFKNQPAEDDQYYAPVAWTRNLLRVVESARAGGHEDRIGDLYTALGERIHDGGDHEEFDVLPVLGEVGIPAEHAEAFDDEAWDEVIRTRMAVGLELTGDDVGTPLIAVDGPDGERVGLFGPVITSPPTGEDALALWDGFLAMVAVPGFWELKRTRTEGPALPVG